MQLGIEMRWRRLSAATFSTLALVAIGFSTAGPATAKDQNATPSVGGAKEDDPSPAKEDDPSPGASPDDALVIVSGPAVVERGQAVEGVFIIDGDATIDGEVDGDVWVLAGDATVSGRIEGDLVLASGEGDLRAGAEVAGDVLYGDEKPTVSPQATVEGEVSDEGWSDLPDALPWIGAFALWLAVTVSSLVLGTLLVLLAPRAVDAAVRESKERLALAIAVGAGLFVALPGVGVAAAASLIGLPLGIGVLLALLPLAAIAYVTTAYVLGRRLLAGQRAVVAFLVGLAILRVLALVPVLGLFVWLAAVVVGLGLLAVAIEAAQSGRSAAPAPAGVG